MTIDRLTARNAARASTAHDEHNFGQLVRQANPGAARRADVQRQAADIQRQAAEARRAVQDQAAQAQASHRELQEQAALEREQRQATRPQMPQPMSGAPRLS